MVHGGSDSVAGVREGDILAGKYRVERVLGIGGMGVVVAAHHLQLDEKVALKFLLPDALGDGEAVARFAREARNAVKIKSEHVARVIDVGTLPNGAPYLVMEYLEGGDLAAWIKQRGALPIEQALDFVLQACIAVADAHALGIVHRDLKPANLFCLRRSDGQLFVKVLDFGISKMTDASGLAPGSMTRTSAMMGSPLYMSPEQMRSARDVDAQTDLWALGVILFELIAGRPPFQADSVTQLAIQVASEPAPSIRSLRPEVPSELEAVIFKCLEKDRRRRYGNVAELALALLPFAPKRAKASVERISGIIQAAGLSASASDEREPAAPADGSPPSPPMTSTLMAPGTVAPVGRTTRGSTRRKAAIGAGIAGVLVLVALAGSVVSFRRAQHEEREAAAVQPAKVVVSQPTAPPRPSDLPNGEARASVPVGAVGAPGDDGYAVDDGKPVDAARATARAALPVVPPEPTAPKKMPSAGGPPPGATPAATARTPAPQPAAAKCDPPYYFDANGNRMFKKECL